MKGNNTKKQSTFKRIVRKWRKENILFYVLTFLICLNEIFILTALEESENFLFAITVYHKAIRNVVYLSICLCFGLIIILESKKDKYIENAAKNVLDHCLSSDCWKEVRAINNKYQKIVKLNNQKESDCTILAKIINEGISVRIIISRNKEIIYCEYYTYDEFIINFDILSV